MNAILITIGDELLNGRTVDTNSAFLAAELDAAGVRTIEILSISDSAEAIREALDRALGKRGQGGTWTGRRADLVLITGGLGPTHDDVTKTVLAGYFSCALVEHPEVRANLERIFGTRGREVPLSSLGVALVPEGCRVLVNNSGTAPGLWFEQQEAVVVAMPGVPHEMHTMMRESVMPMLLERFERPALVHRTIHTAGIGESMLSEHISDLIENLPGHIKLASLPDMGTVKLRLSATGPDVEALRTEVDAVAVKLASRIERWVFGYDETTLEAAVGALLHAQSATLGTAESCTAGGIATRVTRVPGSSAWFTGGIVAYANSVKEEVLGVGTATLEAHGAVSEATVREMLAGAHRVLGCDYALATSGIAGPDGGTAEKPVGLVFLGVSGPGGTLVREYRFPGNRRIVTTLSITVALHLLRRMLAGQLENETGKR